MAAPNAHITNAEVPQEDHPLLRRAKAKQGEHHRRSASLFVLLFTLAGLLFVAHIVSLRFQRHHFASEYRRPNSPNTTTANTVSSNQWWQGSQVTTTETYLPGLLPKTTNERRKLRWGILGLGRIAHDFTTALIMSGANVTAAAAGSLPNATLRANAFAKLYDVPQSYGTYAAMAEDPNVDIVYIATVNTRHYDPAMMMLKAGKNVLIEKPMTLHLTEAEGLANAAKEANLFLMTNYWTRFFPVMKHVRSVLASGRLGTIQSMNGDFGFPTPPNIHDRYLNRQAGGGAMLDIGC